MDTLSFWFGFSIGVLIVAIAYVLWSLLRNR